MDKSFVDSFNTVEVRNTKKCTCKICDREIINEKIVYADVMENATTKYN